MASMVSILAALFALSLQSLKVSSAPPRLMTVEEAAEFLGVSRNNLYIAARRGDVPSFKVGALVRFDLDELRAWLESNRRGPKAGGDDAAA